MKNLKFIIYNVRSDTDFSSNYITKLESVAYIKVSRDLESRILSEKNIVGPQGPGGPTSAIFAAIGLRLGTVRIRLWAMIQRPFLEIV